MLIPSFLIAVGLVAQLGKCRDVFRSGSALIRIGGQGKQCFKRIARWKMGGICQNLLIKCTTIGYHATTIV